LLSLAIIFLPSLFHRDHRVEVDRVSLIPPKPTVAPIVISRPVKTIVKSAPIPERAFQPSVDESDIASQKAVAKANTSKSNLAQPSSASPESAVVKQAPPTKAVAGTKASRSVSGLNDKGLPNAWVVQLGSFQSTERANELKKKLLKAGYKAYARSVNTTKGQFFRVFVGPYINKTDVDKAKKRLDTNYKVNSRILIFSSESGG